MIQKWMVCTFALIASQSFQLLCEKKLAKQNTTKNNQIICYFGSLMKLRCDLYSRSQDCVESRSTALSLSQSFLSTQSFTFCLLSLSLSVFSIFHFLSSQSFTFCLPILSLSVYSVFTFCLLSRSLSVSQFFTLSTQSSLSVY